MRGSTQKQLSEAQLMNDEPHSPAPPPLGQPRHIVFVAYQQMGRLEDPEFTIKEALIITPYPGASAEEVAQEVSNPIESACQQLGQLERVESESTRGRSVVTVRIKDRFDRHSIPQVWDELRRKIADVQPRLPPAVRGRTAIVEVRIGITEADEPRAAFWHGARDVGVLDLVRTTRSEAVRRFTPAPGRAEASLVGRTRDGKALALVVGVAAN